jgi:two-component system, LytTR family, response regulator
MKIVIIEDEVAIRKMIAGFVTEMFPELIICGYAESVAQGEALLRRENPDIALLDIELKDGTTFDILEKYRPENTSLIFITAYNEFAVKAFRYSAIDYLLKPINPVEFGEAVARAIEQQKTRSIRQNLDALLENLGQPLHKKRKLVLRTSEKIHILDIKNIVRAEADNNYTNFFLSDGLKIMVSTTIKEYESTLSSAGFLRIHQSHLVNLEHVVNFTKRDGGSVVLTDKSEIPVSTRKKQELMEALDRLGF